MQWINNIRLAFLTLALLLFQLCTKAQPTATNAATVCLRAIYRLDYKLDSAIATPKSEQMILRIHHGASCFQSKVKQLRDSLFVSLSHLPEQEQLNQAGPILSKLGKTEIDYSIFKELAKDLVFYHANIGSVDYQYQEKSPLFHWKTMPAKKVVAGYECQQAITTFGGRTWDVVLPKSWTD